MVQHHHIYLSTLPTDRICMKVWSWTIDSDDCIASPNRILCLWLSPASSSVIVAKLTDEYITSEFVANSGRLIIVIYVIGFFLLGLSSNTSSRILYEAVVCVCIGWALAALGRNTRIQTTLWYRKFHTTKKTHLMRKQRSSAVAIGRNAISKVAAPTGS